MLASVNIGNLLAPLLLTYSANPPVRLQLSRLLPLSKSFSFTGNATFTFVLL